MPITVHTTDRSYTYSGRKSCRVNPDGTLDVLNAEVSHDPRAKTPVATFAAGQWVCAETPGASTVTYASSGD